jgi:hypothetical protein
MNALSLNYELKPISIASYVLAVTTEAGGANRPMISKIDTRAGALLTAGVLIGAVIGWSMAKLNTSSAQGLSTGMIPASDPAPTSVRWMLTNKGAIVLGEKFANEAECERRRVKYVDHTAQRIQSTLEAAWGKGYTAAQYPLVQQDIARAQASISDAEATYCSAYPA